MDSFVSSIILTTAVFAALITSITDLIINIMNNSKLKKLERRKEVREIDQYRYTKLYEILLNWHKLDTPWDVSEKSAPQIANERLTNLFLDTLGKYELARPLLASKYWRELDELQREGNILLHKVIDDSMLTPNRTSNSLKAYFDLGGEFSEKLKKSINSQLEELLSLDNIMKH